MTDHLPAVPLRGTGEELGKSYDRWEAESGREIGEGIRESGREIGEGIREAGQEAIYTPNAYL